MIFYNHAFACEARAVGGLHSVMLVVEPVETALLGHGGAVTMVQLGTLVHPRARGRRPKPIVATNGQKRFGFFDCITLCTV